MSGAQTDRVRVGGPGVGNMRKTEKLGLQDKQGLRAFSVEYQGSRPPPTSVSGIASEFQFCSLGVGCMASSLKQANASICCHLEATVSMTAEGCLPQILLGLPKVRVLFAWRAPPLAQAGSASTSPMLLNSLGSVFPPGLSSLVRQWMG